MERIELGVGCFPVMENAQHCYKILNDLSPCLLARAGTGGNTVPMVLEEIDMDDFRNIWIDRHANVGTDGLAPTLCAKAGTGGNNMPFVLEETKMKDEKKKYVVRKLTPVECERLMGFPDNYTEIPWPKGKTPLCHRYRALGNSMCVSVMRWIGERIEFALQNPIEEDTFDGLPYQPELF